MKEQKFYKVQENVLTATLKYLSNKPYVEVAELIKVISASEEIKESTLKEPILKK